jgi:hypothetical protein
MQKFGPIIRYHPHMESSKFVAMRNVLWPVTFLLDNIDMCPQSQHQACETQAMNYSPKSQVNDLFHVLSNSSLTIIDLMTYTFNKESLNINIMRRNKI